MTRIQYYWKQFIDIFTHHQILKLSKKGVKLGKWYFVCTWFKMDKKGVLVDTIYLNANAKGFKKKDLERLIKMGAITRSENKK